MGLNDFIFNCERENKQLRMDIEYYKNKNERIEREIFNLKQALNEIRKVINGEEFFFLMNSETNTHHCSKDKVICEDYFKGKELISKIIDKALGGSDEKTN